MIVYPVYRPVHRSAFAYAKPSFTHKPGKHEHSPGKTSPCQDSHCKIDHQKTFSPQKIPSSPPAPSEQPQGDFITRTLQKAWTWLKALILGPFQDLKWLFEGGASQEDHAH